MGHIHLMLAEPEQHKKIWVDMLGAEVKHAIGSGRGVYFYVIGGGIRLDGESLATGDAAKIWDEASITIRADEPSELIMAEVRLS